MPPALPEAFKIVELIFYSFWVLKSIDLVFVGLDFLKQLL